jgi:tRNA1(Val) A37 N6-methylase TrmN6
LYDAVLMNPPFADNQDITHIRHAWDFLKPGGILVAFVGEHSFIAQERKCQAFRDWLRKVNAQVWELGNGFHDSGTESKSRLIRIKKEAT